MKKPRYFVSNRAGKNIVFDRQLNVPVATCIYREQATLVALALNEREERAAADIDEEILNVR